MKMQQKQGVCAKFYEQPFLKDKQRRLLDGQFVLMFFFFLKGKCNLIVL